jgi:60 kDa SS-A/Ro ribonucleoprotein
VANRTLFKTKNSKSVPADIVNQAGGKAYDYSAEHKLCQYVATGCLSNTFYATAQDQLENLKNTISQCSSELIAKAAVYGAEEGMKEVPSYLLAVLIARGELELVRKIFFRVTPTIKMLCNVVQIIRSGETGRKSFGTATKNLIRQWLASRNDHQLYCATIGQSNPSVADIIKLVHPKPETKERESLYGYILDKPYEITLLPDALRDFIFRQRGESKATPNLPFRALTNLNLSDDEWIQIGKSMPWNTLRMNLNMLNKHGVFTHKNNLDWFAKKLGSQEEVERSKVFPYQLLTTYQNTTDIPTALRNALQDAMEFACANVPSLGNDVIVCPDLSGSMGSPVTGYGTGKTTVTTCVDVAALVSACLARKNPNATRVLAWADYCKEIKFNSRDSIMTLSNQFRNANIGGGTAAHLPLQTLNAVGWKGDTIVYISDNQSWMGRQYYGGTGMESEWLTLKKRSPKTKLICLDIQPYGNTQLSDRQDVMNIGGWGDNCWDVMAKFVSKDPTSFVQEVMSVEL